MFNSPENTRRSAVARLLGGALCSAAPALATRLLGSTSTTATLCSAACWSLPSCSLIACTRTGVPHDWKPRTSSLQAWRLALARVRNLELETRESETVRERPPAESPRGRRGAVRMPQAAGARAVRSRLLVLASWAAGRLDLDCWPLADRGLLGVGHCLGPHVICLLGDGYG
jgi:hypothetical protein